MLLLQAAANSSLNPQDFFTKGSFTTLLGATGMVYIVTGVVQNVFNFKPKWFALALSIIVSFIAASINSEAAKEPALIKHLISLLNGFLIYSSAAGSNQLLNQNQTTPTTPPASDIPLTPGTPPIPRTLGTPATLEPSSPANQKRKFSSNWWS
jgi:hypothetical protein